MKKTKIFFLVTLIMLMATFALAEENATNETIEIDFEDSLLRELIEEAERRIDEAIIRATEQAIEEEIEEPVEEIEEEEIEEEEEPVEEIEEEVEEEPINDVEEEVEEEPVEEEEERETFMNNVFDAVRENIITILIVVGILIVIIALVFYYKYNTVAGLAKRSEKLHKKADALSTDGKYKDALKTRRKARKLQRKADEKRY